MNNICIVVVTFDRVQSLKRLLDSLLRADYLSFKVDLIVSIDHGPTQSDIEALLENFDWPHGESEIRTFIENMGLRTHILKCGSITNEYAAIIVLEDDLIVSPDFFIYASAAVQEYKTVTEIAGISLYAPAFNEMAELAFNPASSEYDTYFLRSAQSWGQCWTKEMWNGFWNWYQLNNEPLESKEDMPARIYSWPESSWKKYFMKYLAVSGKTWVYPYISHSTNFSEIGTHNQSPTAQYQTILSENRRNFNFPKINTGICYDMFFEREGVNITLSNGMQVEVELDLYGTKIEVKPGSYLVTPRKLNYTPISVFGLSSKPHETNLIFNNPGNDLRLYHVNSSETLKLVNYPKKIQYAFYSSLNWYGALIVGLKGLKAAIKKRLKIKMLLKKITSQK